MRVILISGKARAGKDTTARFLKQAFEQAYHVRGERILIVHYADLLKHICRNFFGWDGKKDTQGRNLLQRVGTDRIRAVRPNFWVEFVAEILEMFYGDWDCVIIPDCRFPNEVEVMRQRGFPVTLLRVERPGVESNLTPDQQAHPSETALDDYKWDYILVNNGTEAELQTACERLVNQFLCDSPCVLLSEAGSCSA